MAALQKPINDDLYKIIYTFSDIHGDINNLIINLRDNAKVIKKKDKKKFNQELYDKDLEVQMNSDINDKKYIPDLNYQWIEGLDKILIVIVGDTIDNFRFGSYMDDTNKTKIFGEYKYEEIKIFKFLLEIKKQAQQNNSNIEVLYGNHELINLLGDNRYVSDFAKKTYFTYMKKSISRKKFFELTNEKGLEYNLGPRLFLELDMKIIYVYGDYVFVHGGILGRIKFQKNEFNISNYDELNNRFNDLVRSINRENMNKDNLDDIYKILWERDYSELSKSSNISDIYDASVLCHKLNRALDEFRNGDKNLTLVVGHCTNYKYYIVNNYPTCTFKNLINGDGITEEYGYTGVVSQDCSIFTNTPEDKYSNFKSTFEYCKRDDKRDKSDSSDKKIKLIRVDNASSKAFYYEYIHKNILKNDEKLAEYIRNYLGPRLPQLVKIVIDPNDDNITNISSSLKNKLIHAPINYPQELIDKINELYPPNKKN
jgi:hypothetical protein